MDEIIKISCPVCGGVLQVKSQPGIEKMNVTCPICKNKNAYTSYKQVRPKEEEHTQINTGGMKTNSIIGQLRVISTGEKFKLGQGSNVIGRKSDNSKATIQIPCDTKRMSREHIEIEVSNVIGRGYVHKVRLVKEKVNPTFIGNERLEYGETLTLENHEVIKLPDVDVMFELPDDDATEINV